MRPEPLAFVDRQAISIRDMGNLLVRVGEVIVRRRGLTLYTLNLDRLVRRRQDRAFRELDARATCVTTDGWPVLSLARSRALGLET